MGLDSVKRIASRLKLTGVYGPLFELFDCDPLYSAAVDVTAGNSLFHVVVDTDVTAEKILEVLNAERSGRVTFIPLNRVQAQNVTYPDIADAVPIIKKLRFDEKYTDAVSQVFGKTMVCADLNVGHLISTKHNLNAITLDGDRVDRKGALTGGYHDSRRSRLEAVRALKKAQDDMRRDEVASEEIKKELDGIDKNCLAIQSSLTNMEVRRRRIIADREEQSRQIGEVTAEVETLEQKERGISRSIATLQLSIDSLNQQIEALKADLKAPLQSQLTDQEAAELDRLTGRLSELQKETTDASKQRLDLELVKTEADNELHMNLTRKKDDTVKQLKDIENSSQNGNDVTMLAQNLERLNEMADQMKTKATELAVSCDSESEKARDLESSAEKIRGEHINDQKEVANQQQHTERYLSKRGLLMHKKDECVQKIRELGALPEEVFERYRQESSKRLVRELHKANESLKKYGHVNKKAFEQYNNFTKQRDSLIGRKTELDQSAGAIEDLIKVLDQRKDEAIERTFKQVAKNFEEIFEKLVPLGRGELVIQRSLDDLNSSQESNANDDPTKVKENYTGISITVSFNSKSDEGLLMQQLSGGQKSLVALALIFAIQKCDPAPFYLFDEIDANLDAAYRTSVANMVHELSGEAQFITTTFRPELLHNANKFYGVTFRDRVSRVGLITKDDAMNFVEQEATRA